MSTGKGALKTIAALTLLYTILIALQIGRYLWFDELLTYYIALAPSLRRLVQLGMRWDLNPPTLHILAHYSMRAFGTSAFALRLPSIAAFYAAGVLLFFYGLNKTNLAYAPIPFLLACGASFFRYATEARPYALLAMFFCALLVSWDIARGIVEKPVAAARSLAGRRLALFAVALSSLGLIVCHVFGLVSLLPFLAAEAYRWRKREQADWPMYAALLLPCLGTVLYVPLLHSYNNINFYPSAFQASFHKIGSFYWNAFKGMRLAICIAVLVALLAARRNAFRKYRFSLPAEEALLWGLVVAIPAGLNLMFMRDHGAFWPRYCISTAFGMYTLLGLLLWWIFGGSVRAGYAATAVLAIAVLVVQIAAPLYKRYTQPPVPRTAAALASIEPNLPLVAASGLTFIEMSHYEAPVITERLYYLADRRAEIQYAHSTLFDDIRGFVQAFGLPGHVEPFQAFTYAYPKFLVLGTYDYPEDWLLRKLFADGAQVKVIGTYPLPYKDHRLYEVTMPKPG